MRRYLVLLLAMVGAAFLVFGGDPPEEAAAPDARAFVAACEAGPFAAAHAAEPVEAARLCSCVLAWHLRDGGRLPVEGYASGATPVGATDARAREACLSGRMPR